jgi:ATP-dependent DNA helicase 2 subunit 1
MHKPRADRHNPSGTVRGKSALHQVLESVVKLEKSKVITGPSDSVGFMVWNVDVSSFPPPSMCAAVLTKRPTR